MTEATLEFKIDKNTERIKILEEKVDKNVKKVNETEIDIKGIKKDMSLMGGDIRILINNESKINDGLVKIERKLPKHFWQRFKIWHYFLIVMVILFLIGSLNG
jgi:hypothetical protein